MSACIIFIQHICVMYRIVRNVYINFIIKLILELLIIAILFSLTAHFMYNPLNSYLDIHWILDFTCINIIIRKITKRFLSTCKIYSESG